MFCPLEWVCKVKYCRTEAGWSHSIRGFVCLRVDVRILYKQAGGLICTLLNTCNLESENSPLPFTCVSDVSCASTLSSFWIQVKSLLKKFFVCPLWLVLS